MAKVKIYSQEKKEVGELELPQEIFEVPVKPEILHLVVRAHRAAKRAGTVGVKNRSRIRGGGHKPWRQKGTGRARAGSSRSPLWVGGAVSHGPTTRDYSIKVNRKIKSLAMKMALSARLAEEKLMVVDALSMPEIRTKSFCKVKDTLGLKKALIVVSEEDNNLRLSARNIPGIKILHQKNLSVYDVLAYDQLILMPQVVENIQERLK
ncbi:MAG: 50S ribosomal protein L4 [Desulfovibrionales bacterium]